MTCPSASGSNLYQQAAASHDEAKPRHTDRTRHSDHTPRRERWSKTDGHGSVEGDTNVESGWKAPRRQSKRRLSSNTNTGRDSTSTRQQEDKEEKEGRQAKRAKIAHADYLDELNPPKSEDGPAGPKSKRGRWTEQDLRRIIKRATESPFPGASTIHPTAVVIANSIVVLSVPIDVFNKLQSLLSLIPATLTWKLEFVPQLRCGQTNPSTRIRSNRGCLVVSMPTRMHEAFIPFSNDVANQIFDAHFLPPMYERKEIIQSGSTELKSNVQGLVPDAGISFFESSNTFFVLEVAYSQKEVDAKAKAQRYIPESNGKITFVVLVIVTKKPRKGTADPHHYGEDHLSPDHDTVHVHVYKSVRLPPDILTGEHLVNGFQVFPSAAPAESFVITWADINCGTWSEFCDGARLRSDTPEPSCSIKFDALGSIARSLAGQADDSREGTPLYRPVVSSHVATPVLKKRKFLDSSGPAVVLSSGSTVPSDKERRLDPDWKHSDESSDSLDSSR